MQKRGAGRMSKKVKYKETFAYPLVILFFLNLFHLIKQLAGPKLQLGQLILSCDLWVIISMLPDLDVQVHTLQENRSV